MPWRLAIAFLAWVGIFSINQFATIGSQYSWGPRSCLCYSSYGHWQHHPEPVHPIVQKYSCFSLVGDLARLLRRFGVKNLHQKPAPAPPLKISTLAQITATVSCCWISGWTKGRIIPDTSASSQSASFFPARFGSPRCARCSDRFRCSCRKTCEASGRSGSSCSPTSKEWKSGLLEVEIFFVRAEQLGTFWTRLAPRHEV